MESRLAPAEDGLDDDNAGSVHRYVDLIKGLKISGLIWYLHKTRQQIQLFHFLHFLVMMQMMNSYRNLSKVQPKKKWRR